MWRDDTYSKAVCMELSEFKKEIIFLFSNYLHCIIESAVSNLATGASKLLSFTTCATALNFSLVFSTSSHTEIFQFFE